MTSTLLDTTVTQPTDSESRFMEGTRHLAEECFDEAESCFRETLRLADDLPEAAANLGYLLETRGETVEAERWLRHALALAPDSLEPTLTLGALLTNAKRFKESEAVCQRAIMLRPEFPEPWTNLGVLYAMMKREEEAEQCHRTAMALDSTHWISRFNLAYVLLRQGRYDEGWTCLEARRWYAGLAARMTCPRWTGELLNGKSLLIGFEAGFGDMIQFVRYARVLKDRGARSIDLICHPPLKPLLAGQCGLDRVFAFDEALPDGDWDFWTPPMSAPFHCRSSLETIPARIPYLFADPERAAFWRPRLPAGRPRVGLVWKGNPRFENDRDRSLPSLRILEPLADVCGVHFVSLQKGAGEDEAEAPPGRLRPANLGSSIRDFADAAAIVSQLDLVIAVDTAAAHLAGALGVPARILLPDYKTDWRWLKDRDDSPWYPGVVRLFRQRTMGDWGGCRGVLARRADKLGCRQLVVVTYFVCVSREAGSRCVVDKFAARRQEIDQSFRAHVVGAAGVKSRVRAKTFSNGLFQGFARMAFVRL